MAEGVPDSYEYHRESADGQAFNGKVGAGVADLLLSIIDQQSGVKTICDLGCGNGFLAGQLGRRGFTVLGVDPSDGYMDAAHQHNASDRVTFMNSLVDPAFAERVRATHPAFDLVVSSDVIEHLYHPLEFLQTALSLLRPGGTAVIGTPYHGYLKNIAISLTGKWDVHHSVHWHGGHVKFFSVPSLTHMMLEAGFNAPRFEYYGRMPAMWKNMIAVATKPD
jgi:2-polyprenyl-3-methyl-5-hydroxy-6-metoxy-1,4-benzoquinol methylase